MFTLRCERRKPYGSCMSSVEFFASYSICMTSYDSAIMAWPWLVSVPLQTTWRPLQEYRFVPTTTLFHSCWSCVILLQYKLRKRWTVVFIRTCNIHVVFLWTFGLLVPSLAPIKYNIYLDVLQGKAIEFTTRTWVKESFKIVRETTKYLWDLRKKVLSQ